MQEGFNLLHPAKLQLVSGSSSLRLPSRLFQPSNVRFLVSSFPSPWTTVLTSVSISARSTAVSGTFSPDISAPSTSAALMNAYLMAEGYFLAGGYFPAGGYCLMPPELPSSLSDSQSGSTITMSHRVSIGHSGVNIKKCGRWTFSQNY